MTWLEYHQESERLAAAAEISFRQGKSSDALELYAKAAQAEELAGQELEPTKLRTFGISAVSAVSLYFKAHQLEKAEVLAYSCLGARPLPDFARDQLRGLLQSIWSEQVRERAGVGFVADQVVVSVKGGEIVEGGAPLDLIVDKVQTVQSLFYRTAELLRGLPHRKRGGPNKEIQESCRPWLFQAAPGSYQFAVAVQEPRQKDLFRQDEPKPKEIADHFLKILRASIEDPNEELPELVPDKEYRATFLKLTRNLAPTGKRFGQLDISSGKEARPLSLLPATRTSLGQAIRASRPITSAEPEQEKSISGVLRALHLDEDWIEVLEGNDTLRIDQVSEAVDDVIGPMVNHLVIVHVVSDARGKFHFRDIEPDD